MGRYSDSDEDRKRKKKSKRKSRSRSSSIDSRTSRTSKHKKSKKTKHKRRSHSKSPERAARSKRRSRSLSRDRRRSRSRSRSKPKSYRIRSRSPSPYKSRRRSRSRSRSRRKSRSNSRSRSRRSRTRSKSRSPRRRSKTRSPRRRSRSRSRDRSRRERSRSREKDAWDKSPVPPRSDVKTEKEDPCANIAGFYSMTPSEQAEARLQMALKAAAAAGEKLKEQGVLSASMATSFQEQQQRVKAIESIESDSFTPAAFRSSRAQGTTSGDVSAVLGLDNLTLAAAPSSQLRAKDPESLMHPNLYISSDDKMKNWIQKLTQMRKRKLEGSVMT